MGEESQRKEGPFRPKIRTKVESGKNEERRKRQGRSRVEKEGTEQKEGERQASNVFLSMKDLDYQTVTGPYT